MIKKMFYAMVIFCMAQSAHAYSWPEIAEDIKTQTRLTILESATPGYFYRLERGQSNGGVITAIAEYRFLTADTGWINPFDANKTGVVILGGSIHLDRLARLMFPEFSDYVRYFLPKTSQQFIDKLNIGFFTGHDLDDDSLGYGFYSGLEFKF